MRLHRIRRNEYCGNCVVTDLQFADLTDRLAFGRSRIQLLSSPNVRALLATPPSLSLLRRDNCHATSILEEVLLMGPSFRGALGTRMLACASFGAVAFIAFAACTRDQPTSPLASHRVPGQGASYTVTTLGTYSIPIPATNWPGMERSLSRTLASSSPPARITECASKEPSLFRRIRCTPRHSPGPTTA